MEAKVGIIIPVYNSKDYLVECVKSALSQTYKNIIIYLLDDGSTDGSAAICDALEKEYKKVRTIHLKNGGVSRARNTGITLANKDNCSHIFFLDSDDYIDDQVIKKLITSNKSHVLTGIKVRRFRNKYEKNIGEGEYDVDLFIKSLLNGKAYGFVVPYLFNVKQIVKSSIFFDEEVSYLEDMQFLILYLQKLNIKRIVYMKSGPRYNYRINPSSVTMSQNIQRSITNIFESLNKINQNTDSRYKKEIANSKMRFLERKIALDKTLASLNYYANLIKIDNDLKWSWLTARSKIIYLMLSSKNKALMKLFYFMKKTFKKGESYGQ